MNGICFSLANAAPVNLSCEGNWNDDKSHDVFSLVVDVDKGTVMHGGSTLKIFHSDAGQIFASDGEGWNWRSAYVNLVTGDVSVTVPGRLGFFDGTCKPEQ